MWFVLLSVKGGFKVHSFHDTEDQAKQWRACKESDGCDASVAEMDEDTARDFATAFMEREEEKESRK